MPLTPVQFERFGGLNLAADPAEVGAEQAVDLLNVVLDRDGRVRARSGFTNFTTVAAAASYRIGTWMALTGSSAQVLAGRGTSCEALDYTGASIATQASGTVSDFQRFGTPGGQYMFIANSTAAITRWDTSAFSSPAGMPLAKYLTASPDDNRLVAARITGSVAGSNTSSVRFSDVGDPLTWPANNYVDLTPGDGETIQGATAWRNMVFVFKQTKFFVFYGTTTDAAGNPVFNYRTVDSRTGISGSEQQGCVAGKAGVFFADTNGVYVTTGGEPSKISQAIDPFFRGETLPLFGIVPTENSLLLARLAVLDDLLYVTVPTSSGVYLTFVYDTVTSQWTAWDLDATAVFSSSGSEFGVVLCRSSVNHLALLRYQAATPTTDDGAAITSRYRSGFYDFGSQAEKRIRWTDVAGTGTVALSLYRDSQTTADTAGTLVLGTSTTSKRRLTAQRGRTISHRLAGTGAWEVDRITHFLSHTSPAGEETS